MLALEVIVRGSSNFIGFPDICSKALLDAGFVVMLFLVLHLLGGLLEIGSRSVHFAASLFYYRISRGPKGSNTSTSLISSNSLHRLGITKAMSGRFWLVWAGAPSHRRGEPWNAMKNRSHSVK